MTAFVISRTIVRDAEKFQHYATAAAPTVAAHGGRLVQRGVFGSALLGDASPHGTGIMEFPDMEAVEAWFHSDAYRALGSLRDEACEMTLVAYQAPPA